MKIRTHNYESVGDFVDDALLATESERSAGRAYKETGRDSFFGTTTIEEAKSLLSHGWPDGARKIASLRDRLSVVVAAAVQARASAVRYAVEGLWVDEGRLVTGDPECCGSYGDGDETAARVVSLRFNAAVSGSVSPRDITARGVAVLAAVDLVESCGTRCEVVYSQGSQAYGDGGHAECNVLVKPAGQPVDLDRLAFALTHPSFFRRFGFAFLEGLAGHNPSLSRPAPLSDYKRRDGVIEIDEVCTADGLGGKRLDAVVLKIAKACGIEIDADEIRRAT